MKRFELSQKAVALFCIYSLGFSIFLIKPPRLFAQVALPADKSDKIEELLESAKTGSPEQTIEALSESTRIARPYAKTDSDLDVLLDLFGLERDRLSFFTDEFKNDRDAVDSSNSKSGEKTALQDLRTRILNQAADLMQMVAKDGITADEARRLLSISKSVSQAVDDLTDQRGFGDKGSFDGAKSSLQKFLTVANGISDLSTGISDRDANRLMSGFRDTIGLIETKLKGMGIATTNPLGVFDYPGALTAAQLQVVNEAFEQVTESLELISQIIENDSPESRRRLSQLLDSIERTLSPENFGRVLLNSAIDRTVAKFPFARTFQALLRPSITGFCEFRKRTEQHKLGRFTPTAYINCRVLDALGRELTGTSYDEVKLESIHPASAEMYKKSRSYNSCGEIFAGTWNFSFTREQRFGFYPAIDCGNVSMEPYFNYELFVDGTRYGRLILAKGPWENANFGLPFDLIDSSGKTIALLITDGGLNETYFDVAPGTYTLKYNPEKYPSHKTRLGKEIRETEFTNVKISAGTITKLVLPVIKQIY